MTSYEAIFTDEQEVSAIMGSSDERVRYIIHDAAFRRQISGALRDKRRRHLAPVGLPRRWHPQLVRNVAGYYLHTPGAFCRIADWIDAGCEVW